MLLRPPFIKQQDVKSQSSNPTSHMQKQQSVKSSSKNKKKESSLGMRKNNVINAQSTEKVQGNTNAQNYDSDNGSVHSVNSRKSKGKTKQSTLAIGRRDNLNQNSAYPTKKQNKNQYKKQQYEIFKFESDDDDKSIGSHASKNSRKNSKKQNSLGMNRNNKVNVKLDYYYNKNDHKAQQKINQKHYLDQQSKVQTIQLNQSVQPASQPLKYNQVVKVTPQNIRNPEVKHRRTQHQPAQRHVSSPFEEITLNREQDQEEPIYVLKQPEQTHNNVALGPKNLFSQKVFQNKPIQSNPFSQKNRNQVLTVLSPPQKLRVQLQESHTIQPQMISTQSVASKSRRNKIFDNENNTSVANTSNVMSSRNNLEGSFEQSRSKSKSKLGGLIKDSRQKIAQNIKNKEKQVQTQQISKRNTYLNRKEADKKPNYNKNNQDESQDNFFTINKSNLVSVSTLQEQQKVGGHKLGQKAVKMQQLQRKQMPNQFFDLGQSQFDLNLSMSNRLAQPSGLKGDSLHFNFQPQKRKGISITTKERSSQNSKSIQSKKHLDRLMRKCQQNQQFLAKSLLSNNSQLRETKKPSLNGPSPKLTKKQDTQKMAFERINQQHEEQQPGWHRIVENQHQFKIKQVQRKQVKKPSQQQIKLRQKVKQRHARPISPQNEQSHKLNNQQQQKQLRRIKQQQLSGNRDTQKQRQFKAKYNQALNQQKNRSVNNNRRNQKTQNQTQNYNYNYNKNNNQTKNQTQTQKQFEQSDLYQLKGQSRQRMIKTNNSSKQKQSQAPRIQSNAVHELSLSQNGSERSNSHSVKKNRKKQSSLNIMKKHKIQVRDLQPRAEQSFYQQASNKSQKLLQNQHGNKNLFGGNFQPEQSSRIEQSRKKVEYKKPNLINFQQSDSQQQPIKSKTDTNFYNYGQTSQKSMRAPSSKPPLSKKSICSSSKSKSKAKQSTLNINVVKKQNKLVRNQNQNTQKAQPKKKNLLDLVQNKNYEGSGYGGSDSQCSFNSRQSFGSANSKGSRKSSNSKKQSTLPITIKNKGNKTNNLMRPSLSKIESVTSQVQFYEGNHSIYSKVQQNCQKMASRQRERQNHQVQPRTIISKDTYFIDERGRLVKKDLIIRGDQVYGRASQRPAEQMAMQRMRRSREHHRSRSKSRDGSNSRMSKKNSASSYQESGYQSSSNHFNSGSSNYVNQGYENQNQKQNLYIQQFIKPVQQPKHINNQGYKFQKTLPNNQRQFQQQFYENQSQHSQGYYRQQQEPVRNVTLNQLFGRNKKNRQDPIPKNNQYQNQYHKQNQIDKQKQRYGPNSRYNGQESTLRKKSLSRTQKAFYNNR